MPERGQCCSEHVLGDHGSLTLTEDTYEPVSTSQSGNKEQRSRELPGRGWWGAELHQGRLGRGPRKHCPG